MTERDPSVHVKVLFQIDRDDGTREVESVWAVRQAEGFRIDNIPFYAKGFALGDVVSAEADSDGLIRCTGLVTASAHSTIRLWFGNAQDVQRIREELSAMRCQSELDLPRLVAVDVPPEVPYSRIRMYLDDKEREGTLEYEEGCLGQRQQDIDERRPD
jgi:hypothetical protein